MARVINLQSSFSLTREMRKLIKIKFVYRLPSLPEPVIRSCPKELHTTLKSKMDNDDGLQELIKEADSL